MSELVRIGTTRPHDFDLGYSPMKDLLGMIRLATELGESIKLDAVRRPRYNDVVYDLYAPEEVGRRWYLQDYDGEGF